MINLLVEIFPGWPPIIGVGSSAGGYVSIGKTTVVSSLIGFKVSDLIGFRVSDLIGFRIGSLPFGVLQAVLRGVNLSSSCGILILIAFFDPDLEWL